MSNARALVERMRALARGLRPHEAADLRAICDLASSVITPPQGMQEAVLSREEIAEMEAGAIRGSCAGSGDMYVCGWPTCRCNANNAVVRAVQVAIAHIRASGQQPAPINPIVSEET